MLLRALRGKGMKDMACETCTATPQRGEDLPFTDREDLFSDSHEGLALCRCRSCGRLFARYWWELIDWDEGEDEIRRYWVPLDVSEADELRERRELFRDILKSRRHLFQEADGSLDWVPAGAPYLPTFLPPGSPASGDGGYTHPGARRSGNGG